MPQLPAIQIEPRNALLDFSPISNAIDSNRRNALMQREDARQNEELTLRKDQMQYQRGRDQKLDALQQVEWFGKTAAAVDREADPARRGAMWQRILERHPDKASLTPEYLDPVQGPKLVMAEAGQWRDPRDDQKTDLELQYKRAQINNLNEKANDPIEQLLIERLRGGSRGQAPAMPQQPMLQPQSFNGAMPMSGPMPGVQLVADEAQPQPPMPMAPSAETPRQFNTPFGPMTADDAQALAGPMLLNPKYSAAGKAILDSIQGGGEGALGKAGENAVDEKAIGMVDLAGRLDSIAQGFKPEYQTYETAAKMYGLSWQDSFEATRKNMKPEDRQKLADYTSFKQNATNNLSEYIKYITGAAMGIQEEGRIRKGMPDPEKDSPAQFEAKMRNAVGQSKLALARYNYLKRNGYDDRTIQTLAKSDRIGAMVPLSDMQGIINQRLDQAAQEMKSRNPSLDPQSLKQQLRVIQRREFGI